jgi:hypothetical protein
MASMLSKAALAGPALALSERLATPERAAGRLSPDQSGQPVYIVLWFDTEDYILPASDDAAKRLAEFLTAQGVRANFKIVGEKARVLEQRHRADVIAALKKHEIGYHSNTHSQQPTIAEYESALDWEQGAEEFDRRERAGFDDVARVFGKGPTCFGQPGSSWAPQVFPALRKWGVNVYLDDGKQVGLEGTPFWYGGMLNIFNIDAGRGLEQNDDWSNLETAKAYFAGLHKQLSTRRGGGFVSFMFHPTQFVSAKFWDAVNFADGANPPRKEWRYQPQLTKAQSERAFQYFEELVKYIRTFSNVRFITATEALALYKDAAQGRSFSPNEVAEIAGKVTSQVGFQANERFALSASEIFALLNAFVARALAGNNTEAVVLTGTPYGPSSIASSLPGATTTEIPLGQFTRTVLDVKDFLKHNRQVPNAVWMGSSAVQPESYLVALAQLARTFARHEALPSTVRLSPAELEAGKWVAKDSPEIWEWPIFPPGFHSRNIIELARLQAWTLKPAMLPSER